MRSPLPEPPPPPRKPPRFTTKYMLCFSDNPYELSASINEMLGLGYKLYGPTSMAVDNYKKTHYSQAMIHEERTS